MNVWKRMWSFLRVYQANYFWIGLSYRKMGCLFYGSFPSQNAFAYDVIKKRSPTSVVNPQIRQMLPLDDKKWTCNSISEQIDSLPQLLLKNQGKSIDEPLSSSQLMSILSSLDQWSMKDEKKRPSFVNLIKTCDAELVFHLQSLHFKESLTAMHLLYTLGFARHSEFIQKAVEVHAHDILKMNSKETVEYMFFVNLRSCFPRTLQKHVLEDHLSQLWKDFSLKELAVVAMGYFNCAVGFSDLELVRRMISAIIVNAATIEPIVLNSLLKVIRKSTASKGNPVKKPLVAMMHVLQPQIPRLNPMTCIQLLTVTNGLNLHFPQIIDDVVQHFLVIMKSVRLKDIERLAMAIALAGHHSAHVEQFWAVAEDELLNPERLVELEQRPHVLLSLLHYFVMDDRYPLLLFHIAMQPRMIQKSLGTSYSMISRIILSLDWSLQIERPYYDGPRLEHQLAEQWANRARDLDPSRAETHSDNFILKLMEATRRAVDRRHSDVRLQMTRPHFTSPDVAILDRSDGRVRCLLVPGTRVMYQRHTHRPTGVMQMRLRQLNHGLALSAVDVPWFEFLHQCSDPIAYLRTKIDEAMAGAAQRTTIQKD